MAETTRKRARKPKTKTGCITCKIRRIKCDEGKPNCRRCTSTGRKCDGYESGGCELVKSEVFNETCTDLRGISASIIGDRQEQRAFEFFRYKTAVEMSGFFQSHFWDGLILQASHSEPAILHAVIALGSLHEMYLDGESMLREDKQTSFKRQFALQQSNKAIGYLTKPSYPGTARSREAILMSCVLFICLETFQGNHNGALEHLDSGLKILSSLGVRKPKLDTDVMSRTSQNCNQSNLIPLFSRLDMQATTYFPRRPLFYDPTLEDDVDSELRIGPQIPQVFTSTTEANDCLQSQIYWVMHYIQLARQYRESGQLDPNLKIAGQFPKRFLVAQIAHTKQLGRWLAAVNALLKDPQSQMTPQQLRCAVLMKMQQITGNILLASTIFDDQMEYDDFTADFGRVVVLAGNLLASSISSISDQKPYCSFDMSVIPSLYNVGCRCRDPVIRRKAIALLSASPRREGIWDSEVSAAIARRIMDLEEEGLSLVSNSQCVPMEKRIHILDKEFVTEERTCIVKFQRGKMGFFQEWITW